MSAWTSKQKTALNQREEWDFSPLIHARQEVQRAALHWELVREAEIKLHGRTGNIPWLQLSQLEQNRITLPTLQALRAVSKRNELHTRVEPTPIFTPIPWTELVASCRSENINIERLASPFFAFCIDHRAASAAKGIKKLAKAFSAWARKEVKAQKPGRHPSNMSGLWRLSCYRLNKRFCLTYKKGALPLFKSSGYAGPHHTASSFINSVRKSSQTIRSETQALRFRPGSAEALITLLASHNK